MKIHLQIALSADGFFTFLIPPPVIPGRYTAKAVKSCCPAGADISPSWQALL